MGWKFLIIGIENYNWRQIIEIINKFLLAGDRVMSQMYLRQSRFTYTAWGRFNKHLKYKNLKKQEFQNIFIKTS